MIEKTFGNVELIITDSAFGDVIPGDEDFLKNLERTTGKNLNKLAWMKQTHSPHVQWVDSEDFEDVLFPDTDGLITQERGRLLITKTADCVPILLWNQEEQIIAALHCGWKGFFRGIIESFVDEIKNKDISLSGFSAFLGPHLRVDDFEVREDFVGQIPEEKKSFLHERDGKFFYNMTEGVIDILKKLGVNEVQDSGINTYNNPDYFSYRSWCHLAQDQRPEKYSTFANCLFISE